MRCRFEKIAVRKAKPFARSLRTRSAFSLIEAIAALGILALVCSSVLVVIERCTDSATDSILRMQAFEVARENIEKLLSAKSVSETTEYGISEIHPQIQWATTVESFYEPLTGRMWIQANCSAEYSDSQGELQTVELVHWLTDVSREQLMEMLKEMDEELKAEQIIEDLEDAADYAGVDADIIEQWVENGMPTTKDGYFIKDELDFYKEYDGEPTIEAKKKHGESKKQLQETQDKKSLDPDQAKDPESQEQDDADRSQPEGEDYDPIVAGRPLSEWNEMTVPEIVDGMFEYYGH